VYQSSRASHIERWFSLVKRVDQAGSACTAGGLVDIAPVGDLVGLHRRRLGHQQDPSNRYACAAGARYEQPRAAESPWVASASRRQSGPCSGLRSKSPADRRLACARVLQVAATTGRCASSGPSGSAWFSSRLQPSGRASSVSTSPARITLRRVAPIILKRSLTRPSQGPTVEV